MKQDFNITLTNQQLRRIIELLEREWVNTGKSFYVGLSDNITKQAVKQENKITDIEIMEGGINVSFSLNGERMTACIEQDQEGAAYFIWYDNSGKAENWHTVYLDAITENN